MRWDLVGRRSWSGLRVPGTRVIQCVSCLLALVGAAAPPAGADEPTAAATSVTQGWTPRVALGFDIVVQNIEGEFKSNNVPLLDGGTRGFVTEDDISAVPATLTLDGMLLTPALAKGLGKPRLFVRGGGQIPIKVKHVILRDDLLDNQSELTVKTVGMWSAGLGVEFTLPVSAFELFFRPSVEYFGERVRYRGSTELIEQADPNDFLSRVTTFRAGGSKSKTYHGIGSRFEIEAVVARLGPLGVSLYGEARFAWLLGDRQVEFSAANEVGTGDGRFSFDSKQLVSQGGAGLRLTWTGGE